MRVIAGTARRQLLVAPSGVDTRPTQDIIKETLFNMIQFDVPGAVFVDLCGGSGAIGIEALSRGASKAYFAENGRQAIACITENLHKTHFDDKGVILKMDVQNALHQIHEKHVDIVYIDPPYASEIAKNCLLQMKDLDMVDEDTIIIVETSLDSDFESLEDWGYTLVREKDYKSQRHLFLRKNA